VAAPGNTRDLVDRLLVDAEVVRVRVDGVDDDLALRATRIVDGLHRWRDGIERRAWARERERLGGRGRGVAR
jgi:hypothetical protein